MLLFKSSCMCKRCRCSHKQKKRPKDVYVKLVSASTPFTHAWTPEKNRLISINFQFESFYLYLCWLYKNVYRVINGTKTQKKLIELWTNPKQTGDNALVQSKATKTIYINSIRIILKCTANICFLEMRICCYNSADGFHGISVCEWHTVELLDRLNNLGVITYRKRNFAIEEKITIFPLWTFHLYM